VAVAVAVAILEHLQTALLPSLSHLFTGPPSDVRA
jgi:hypothetical protein